MPDIIRYFGKDVESRLEALEDIDDDIELTELGQVEFENGAFRYPIYYILAERPGEHEKHDVLLTAGLHGDEPAGVYALLDFLNLHVHDYLGMFRFHVYPCINPSGFEIGTTENISNINLNREFKLPVSGAEETKLMMQYLAQGPENYLFTMDMHETGENEDPESKENPKEYFIYEICPDPQKRVGDKIISALECDEVPICRWPTISEDINCNGVIWYPEGANNEEYLEGTCLDCFLVANDYTEQAFTTESVLNNPLESRVRVQLISLFTALDEIARRIEDE